jgi:hypothetical protein
MKIKNRRTLIANIVKTLIAYVVTALFGYIMYRFFLNAPNIQEPLMAKARTIIFSIVIFAIFVYLSVRIHNLPTRDERKVDEKTELTRLQAESGYCMDYMSYFKNQIKTRLWGGFIPVFILQLPLIVNYAMVSFAEGFTVYTSPISLYKFYTPSIFVWEILGRAWFLAPLLFTAVYITAFLISLYYSQKDMIPEKPSWYGKE